MQKIKFFLNFYPSKLLKSLSIFVLTLCICGAAFGETATAVLLKGSPDNGTSLMPLKDRLLAKKNKNKNKKAKKPKKSLFKRKQKNEDTESTVTDPEITTNTNTTETQSTSKSPSATSVTPLTKALPGYERKITPENIAYSLKRMEESIQKSIETKQIPGCAIAVVYRNQVIFLRGYGARTMGKPDKIDPDTVFQLGSVSKPIAATLASVLEQQGFLNLDDPIRKYLPNFTIKGAKDQENVKVKNVLNHTTGVPRSGFNGLIEAFAPYSKIVRALQTTRIIAPVGAKYDYHNAMYGMIADITEKATKKSFSDILKSKLLHPLNMTRTSATLNGLMNTPNRASPHTRFKKGGLRAAEPYSSGYYAVAPAGGINSSARDMANFLKAQMGGFPEIVTNRALARIHRPLISTHNKLGSDNGATTIKDSSYGLGWRILSFADHKLVYHGGWVKGFTNFVGFMPDEKIGIVVLHNGDTKFSARTAVKFLELAMGMPEVSLKENKKNRGSQSGKKIGKAKGKGKKKK